MNKSEIPFTADHANENDRDGFPGLEFAEMKPGEEDYIPLEAEISWTEVYPVARPFHLDYDTSPGSRLPMEVDVLKKGEKAGLRYWRVNHGSELITLREDRIWDPFPR